MTLTLWTLTAVAGAAISAPAAAARAGKAPAADVENAARRSQTKPVSQAWDLLKDPRFKTIYHKALGPELKDSWLWTLDGPSVPNKTVDIAGAEYVLAASCKSHDCGDNTVVLLYSAAQRIVYGKIVQPPGSRLIGAPPPEVAAALERFWTDAWGQKR